MFSSGPCVCLHRQTGFLQAEGGFPYSNRIGFCFMAKAGQGPLGSALWPALFTATALPYCSGWLPYSRFRAISVLSHLTLLVGSEAHFIVPSHSTCRKTRAPQRQITDLRVNKDCRCGMQSQQSLSIPTPQLLCSHIVGLQK